MTHDAMSEAAYPYKAVDQTCAYNPNDTTGVRVSSYTPLNANDIPAFKSALAQQPISVSIEADTLPFQFYTSGILDTTACGTTLDHAVLAVGYGIESGIEYWLVKNSWGTAWGDQGYIKLAIVDGDGICGIQMAPQFPSV